MGTINALISGSQGFGFGPMAMMLVMVAIITFSAIVMGSGNAPFFAFAALTPAVAAHTGLQPVLMGLAAKKSLEAHRPVKISEITV